MSGKRKKGKHMEAINKPQEAMIITQGMTEAFVDLLVNEKCSTTYWNDCQSTKKNVSSSVMDKLKEMCNGED